MTPQPKTITVPEMAEQLQICEGTVYRMLREGTIPCMHIGKRFIVSRAAFGIWLDTLGVRPAA